MKFSALLEIDGEAEKLVKAIGNEDSETKRSSLKIKQKDNKVEIKVSAEDAVAFRATLNSITQLLAVYQKIKNIE